MTWRVQTSGTLHQRFRATSAIRKQGRRAKSYNTTEAGTPEAQLERALTIIESTATSKTTYHPTKGIQWTGNTDTTQALGAVGRLFLPDGYPLSVPPDYLSYQLWTLPAHITGWLGAALTTSSLLKAVGISAGPVGATAAAATIKWIAKDGVGAAGRLVVGGRLGLEFDDDPRRWRMIAECITSVGLALEIATAIYPSNFLLLAGLGNLTKAVGKGLGKPVFRVIQTHFALSTNVGAVAAKEEVWEVTGQLVGYAASLLLLEALEDAGGRWQLVLGSWAVVQTAHVMFRYQALSVLRFRYLNQKRACAAAVAHVKTGRVPSIKELNADEPLLSGAADVQPRIRFGCSVQEAWGCAPSWEQLDQVFRLYRDQMYILVWRDNTAYVLVKEAADSRGLLRATWQAAWLLEHSRGAPSGSPGQGADAELVRKSLVALHRDYAGFLEAARLQGWNVDGGTSIKLGPVRVSEMDASDAL